MRKAWVVMCLAASLLVAAPAVAVTGACWMIEDELFETPTQGGGVCVDNVPKAACLAINESDPDVELEFSKNKTCAEIFVEETGEKSDGICIMYDDALEQDICAWIGVEPVSGGVEVDDFCTDGEFLEGTWRPDLEACPTELAIEYVPALPDRGALLLALLLVGGGLLVARRMRALAPR